MMPPFLDIPLWPSGDLASTAEGGWDPAGDAYNYLQRHHSATAHLHTAGCLLSTCAVCHFTVYYHAWPLPACSWVHALPSLLLPLPDYHPPPPAHTYHLQLPVFYHATSPGLPLDSSLMHSICHHIHCSLLDLPTCLVHGCMYSALPTKHIC